MYAKFCVNREAANKLHATVREPAGLRNPG